MIEPQQPREPELPAPGPAAAADQPAAGQEMVTDPGDDPSAGTVPESEIDRLVAQVSGPEDTAGMAALWRVTMHLPHWWFIAVGEEGQESPAAAEVDDRLMLLAFTDGERARRFAVEQDMIGEDEDLAAIALPPQEVVESTDAYRAADIAGLMFDCNISGFYLPADQMQPVWDAVMPPSE